MKLGAVDVFHLRGHQAMRAMGMPGNFCALVVALDGPLDDGWWRARVGRALREVPELSWRLHEGFLAGLGAGPEWRPQPIASPPVAERSVAAGDDALHRTALALLAEPLDTTWRIDRLRQPGRDALVLRWLHPFMDAPGAARLVAWLGSDEPPPPAGARHATADHLVPAGRRERHELARRYFRHTMRLAARPIASLYTAGPPPQPRLASGGGRGMLHAVRLRLDARQTAHFYQSLRTRAQLADNAIVLWAAARLCDRLLVARGLAPVHYLVPVPLTLDARGERQRMFGNHLTMMMLELDRDDLADEARAVANVARQRRDIVRERLDAAMVSALAVARGLGPRLYDYASRRPFGGERGSLVVSNPGELAVERFGAREVTDAYTLPTALVPPGFQVIATRHRGCLSLEVVFVAGAASVAEVRAELGQLERDLLGAGWPAAATRTSSVRGSPKM